MNQHRAVSTGVPNMTLVLARPMTQRRVGPTPHAFNMNWLVALILLSLSFCSGAAPAPREIGAAMQVVLREEDQTGAVWSTVENGNVQVGASGIANADTGDALRPDHRVHVGSVAKTVLAIGVLRLVSEGRLSLDSDVSVLLPDLSFDNPWASSSPIRVRHLLAHTAGLDNLRFWQAFSRRPTPDTPLRAAFADDASLLRVNSRPGARFAYSNMGYTLLGMIVESVTSQRYEDYLDAHLLRPLSMHDSTFGFVTQTGQGADARLAMGHFEESTSHAAVPMYLRPASQFTTTAADMARFAAFLMSDGSIDGRPFVTRGLLDELAVPRGTEAAEAGLVSVGHGLALALRDRHGASGACHPGTTVGFNAMLCIFPAQRKAFFVAINSDSESADYDRFNKVLIDALQLEPHAPTARGAPSVTLADWSGIYVLAPNGMRTLAWVDTAFNFVRVRAIDGELRIRPFQSSERTLVPMGGALLGATDRTTPSHVLLQSPEGDRLLSDGLRTYQRASWLRMILLWTSVIAGLSGLVYVLAFGIVRAVRGRMRPQSTALFAPMLAIVALALPVPFFLLQSFLDLGDVTIASTLLAVVAALLPIAMVVGLVEAWRLRASRAIRNADIVAMLAALQWLIVLMAAGLIPLRLWAL
jgi:CubicO group peptidase (beta-lactamase class C family)